VKRELNHCTLFSFLRSNCDCGEVHVTRGDLPGEMDSDCRLNALRLIQSLLSDDGDSSQMLVHEAREVVSFHQLYSVC